MTPTLFPLSLPPSSLKSKFKVYCFTNPIKFFRFSSLSFFSKSFSTSQFCIFCLVSNLSCDKSFISMVHNLFKSSESLKQFWDSFIYLHSCSSINKHWENLLGARYHLKHWDFGSEPEGYTGHWVSLSHRAVQTQMLPSHYSIMRLVPWLTWDCMEVCKRDTQCRGGEP